MKKNIALVFVSVLFVFCLFESYLRFTNYQPWLRSEPGQFQGVEITASTWPDPHPEFGWTFNKHHPVPHRDKHNKIDLVYFGNKEGFRDSKWKSTTDISLDTNNIIVFGDSNVFGFGVEEEERISNQLEKLLNNKYNVYNIAVPGWGLDQMMLAFKKYAPIVKPRIAIIAFINDDLHRSLEAFRRGGEHQNKPSFRLKNGSLELRKVDDEWRFYKYFKKNIFTAVYTKNI